jgi:hypothetical protein
VIPSNHSFDSVFHFIFILTSHPPSLFGFIMVVVFSRNIVWFRVVMSYIVGNLVPVVQVQYVYNVMAGGKCSHTIQVLIVVSFFGGDLTFVNHLAFF